MTHHRNSTHILLCSYAQANISNAKRECKPAHGNTATKTQDGNGQTEARTDNCLEIIR